MPVQTAEIKRFASTPSQHVRDSLPGPEKRPDLYFQTSFTVDTASLGLFDSQSSQSPVEPRSSYQRTLIRLQQDGIRHSVKPEERQNDGSDGRFSFNLAVPRAGLEGITDENDQLVAVRAHVIERVIYALGLGGNIKTVEGWGGRKFYLPDGVFPPSPLGQEFTTDIMAKPEYRKRIERGRVLDVGTGSGILGLAAGLMGAKQVTVTDLNPDAITAAKVSWALNGLDQDKLLAIEADSLKADALKESQFSLIVANPPVQPLLETDIDNFTDRETWQAWNEGGSRGNEVLLDILEQGIDLLEPGGIILTTTSSRHGHNKTVDVLKGMNGKIAQWRDDIIDKELPLGEQYEPYIPIWKAQQTDDGDPRIWQKDEGQYYHRLMVLHVERAGQLEPAHL